MPVEENGTTSPTSSSSTPGAQVSPISDLGDILLDKSMDTVQKNDFVPVGKDDLAGVGQESEEEEIHFAPSSDAPKVPATIEQQATVEDLQSIMLDNVTSVSPFQKEPATPVVQDAVPEMQSADSAVPAAESMPSEVDTPVETEFQAPSPEIETTQDILGDISLSEPTAATEIQSDTVDEVIAEPTTSTEEEGYTSVETKAEDSLSDISLDLGDSVTQEPASTVVEDAPQADIVQSATEEINNIDISTDTATGEQTQESVETEASTTEEATEPSNIDLSSIDMTPVSVTEPEPTTEPQEPAVVDVVASPEATASTVDTNMFDKLDSLQASIEQHTVVATTPEVAVQEVISEITPEVETPVPSETPVTASVAETTTQVVSPSVEEQPITPSQETAPEVVNATPVSAESAALETIANDISEGIDLDSLMPNANPAPAVQMATPVPTTTIVEPAKKTLLSGIVGDNPSSQKKALIGLGLFAALGLAFFAYQLMASSSTAETPVVNPSTPVEQGNDIGDAPAEDSTEETTPITTGEDTTQETTTGEQQGTVEESTGSTVTPPVPVAKTREELVLIAKRLADDTRSTLIKATINKNVDARASAFALQKDIETFKQALEKTNDITTLNDSEKSADALQQRLDAIIQQLNGSSQ